MDYDKHLTNQSSNDMIRNAVRKIALKHVVDLTTGVVKGTSRITGYVAKIHMDEDDELFGTVDVQEFADWAVVETEGNKIGYHEGVQLTALKKNGQGYLVVPKLHSEVVVSQDPATGNEYVTMFSHVDIIQFDSHEIVSIGVREREEYDPDDPDSPDVKELALTGIQSNTTYKKDEIKTTIQGDGAANHTSQLIDSTKIVQTIGDDKTSLSMTQDSFDVEHNHGAIKIDDNEATVTQGASKVKVTDGVVYVGDDSGVDDAVLGVELASILEELLNALGQVKTTTQLGPQPFINLAQFLALKAKISAFKGAHSGFLTRKVQIQK